MVTRFDWFLLRHVSWRKATTDVNKKIEDNLSLSLSLTQQWTLSSSRAIFWNNKDLPLFLRFQLPKITFSSLSLKICSWRSLLVVESNIHDHSLANRKFLDFHFDKNFDL